MIIERQLKGIIVLSVILSFIPFIGFIKSFHINSRGPVLSASGLNNVIVEIVAENGLDGIYFARFGTTVNQLFSQLDIKRGTFKDIRLKNGMKIQLALPGDQRGFAIEEMDAAKRLALGMPLDINRASFDDLKLIPGIGDVLAANILGARTQIGSFDNLDQLTQIKGIKEKRLAKLKSYLYVDKVGR